MSVVPMRGRSLTVSTRGRKRTRSARKSTSRSSRSSSGVSLLSAGSRYDRHRSWPYPQTMSGFFDPFPSKMRAVLRYSTTCLLNPGSNATAHYLLRCNSIHDPDFSGAGHQPYGHDTYEGIYNHYQVLKSVCSVTFAASAQVMYGGITITDDASVSGTYDTVREVKPTKFGVFQGGAGMVPLHLTQTFVMTDVYGFDAGGKTTAQFGGNPADQSFFDIWAQASDPLSDIGQVTAVMTVAYYVEFTELKDLGQS